MDAAGATEEAPLREGLDRAGLASRVGCAASPVSYRWCKTVTRHMEPLGQRVAECSALVPVARNPEVNQTQRGAELMISAPEQALLIELLHKVAVGRAAR